MRRLPHARAGIEYDRLQLRGEAGAAASENALDSSVSGSPVPLGGGPMRRAKMQRKAVPLHFAVFNASRLYDDVDRIARSRHRRMIAVADDGDDAVLAGRQALEGERGVARTDVDDLLRRRRDDGPVRRRHRVEEKMVMP